MNIKDSITKNNIRKGTQRILLRIDRRYIVFGIFFIISSILWFLIALNRRYTTVLDYSITYTNIPENKAILNQPAKIMEVEVTAHGFALLKHYLHLNLDIIQVDVKKLMKQDFNESQPTYYILTKPAQKQLTQNLSSELQVLSIMPDSLVFQFSEVVSKKVKVIPNFTLEFEKQHKQQGELEVIPDSVTVSGPKLMLDTLEQIHTKHLKIDGLNSSTSRNIAIRKIESLQIEPKRVVVNINIEKYTEQILKIPITTINVPKSDSVDLEQKFIDVRFVVGISDFGTIEAQDFKAEVDCKNILDMPDRLNVQLISFPSNIRLIGYTPKNVNYVLITEN